MNAAAFGHFEQSVCAPQQGEAGIFFFRNTGHIERLEFAVAMLANHMSPQIFNPNVEAAPARWTGLDEVGGL